MKLFLIAQLMWDRRCAAAAGAFARLYCARLVCLILASGPASFSFFVFASVRIPGGVAHIEIGVEVNKWESGLASELENSVLRFSTALQA